MFRMNAFALCGLILIGASDASSRKISVFQPDAPQSSLNTFDFTASHLGDPEDIARDFISSQKQNLGYFSAFASDAYDTQDLELEKTSQSQAGTHVIFQQKLENIPVFGQQLKVHLRQNQSVLLMNGQYVNLDEAEVQNIVVIQPNQAISLAEADLGYQGQEQVSRVEEIFIPREEQLVRGYKVLTILGSQGEFVSLIDAKSGKILKQYNQVLHPSGTNNPKSKTNLKVNYKAQLQQLKAKSLEIASAKKDIKLPLDEDQTIQGPSGTVHSASIKTNPETLKVNLTGLDESGKLSGKSVQVLNGKDEAAVSKEKKFHFDPESTHYHEVMVYYHIEEFSKYLKQIGVKEAEKPVQATVHHNDDDNSFYSPDKKALFYGDGGVPDSADADIVLHEFGHSVVDRLSGIQGGWGSQAGAMHEGFGDYVAATYFDSPNIGEWDSSAYSESGFLRTMDNRKVFPDDLTQSVHDDGEIWGGTLWDLRKKLGKDTTDQLVFHSLGFLPEKPTFKDGLIAILSVDETRFKGEYKESIQKVFTRRGIRLKEKKIAKKQATTFNNLYTE